MLQLANRFAQRCHLVHELDHLLFLGLFLRGRLAGFRLRAGIPATADDEGRGRAEGRD
jgi:hypothetical protein